jgi:hypothetical protein
MTTSATIQRARRHLRGEAPWVPADLGELDLVRAQLLEAGHSSAVVNGVTGWLVGKALGATDTTNAATRARYRQLLEAAGPSPIPGLKVA